MGYATPAIGHIDPGTTDGKIARVTADLSKTNKVAMDAGAKWSVKLANGENMNYRIIGINHDELADGSGKAGLTFLTTSTTISSRMNATGTSSGAWEASELVPEDELGRNLEPHAG